MSKLTGFPAIFRKIAYIAYFLLSLLIEPPITTAGAPKHTTAMESSPSVTRGL